MLSELGAEACGTPALDSLLNWDDAAVRFWAIDLVIACAAELPGEIVAQAIDGVREGEDVVRVAAAHLVATSPSDVLERAVDHVEEEVRPVLRWLLDAENSATSPDFELRVQSADLTVGIMAAAAAARKPDSHRQVSRLLEMDLALEVRSVLERLRLVLDAR